MGPKLRSPPPPRNLQVPPQPKSLKNHQLKDQQPPLLNRTTITTESSPVPLLESTRILKTVLTTTSAMLGSKHTTSSAQRDFCSTPRPEHVIGRATFSAKRLTSSV